MFKRILARVSAFRRDESGASAVELSLLLPFLLFSFLGVNTLADAQRTSIEVAKTASTVGDLVSRVPRVDEATLDGIFDAADAMLGPQLAPTLEMYAAGVEMKQNGDGTPKMEVLWVRHTGNLTGRFCNRRPIVGQNLRDARVPRRLKQMKGQFFVYVAAKLEKAPLFGDGIINLTNGTGKLNHEYRNMFLTRNELSTTCTGCSSQTSC